MKSLKYVIAVIFLITAYDSFGQKELTLEQAINIALENNYEVQLEKHHVEQAKNRVSRALSGQMPVAEINAGYEWGYADAETQTLALDPGSGGGDNPPIALDGDAETITAQAQVSVPIFDGFKGRYTYKQLENTHEISKLRYAGLLENTISKTVSTYLKVARYQSIIELDKENIQLSLDRYNRARTDEEYGASGSLKKLQAQVDLKNDSANYRKNKLAYENSLRELNLVLVLPTDSAYTVEQEVQLTSGLNFKALKKDMLEENKQLKTAKLGIENASYQTKIAASTKYPTIQGYANATYLDAEDEASFIQRNEVLGPNVGIQLSWNVFTGGANKIKRQNAEVEMLKQQTQLNQIRQHLENQLTNAYASYTDAKAQLRIERSNLETFQLNYEKVKEDYQRGIVDAADLRRAQLNLNAAKNRILDLEYQVKQSEIRLLKISGRLR